MRPFVPVVSNGLGVESVSILLRMLREPSVRDFALEDLIVITAMTGSEWADTCRDFETHILPLFREYGIRFVQVARAGRFEKDGIVVLDDSRCPQKLYAEGAYKLMDELLSAGTTPQFGSSRLCSLKFKAFVIERWLEQNLWEPIRHTFGYNAEENRRIEKSEAAIRARVTFGFNAGEQDRIDKAKGYDRPLRTGHYPLAEWGWDRERCLDYIHQVTGVRWKKSACPFCAFSRLGPDLIGRQFEQPGQTAEAMVIERNSLAMNPRGQLYRKQPLYEVVSESGNTTALEQFDAHIRSAQWAVYRVRRVYKAKGKAQRCVEKLEQFPSEAEALRVLAERGRGGGLTLRKLHGLTYLYAKERGHSYPATEDYLVASLAHVDTKTRYGLDNFEAKWSSLSDLYCGQDDLPLFQALESQPVNCGLERRPETQGGASDGDPEDFEIISRYSRLCG